MTENTDIDKTPIEFPQTSYKKELIIGAIVVFAVIAIIAAIVFAIANSGPKVDYPPTVACDTLTSLEAQELLGNSAFKSADDPAVISGDLATSRCGYTDGTNNTETMIVAAVILRAGINDKGVEQNKTEFVDGTPTQGVEVVKDVGDSAYFNQVNGQLNVLKDKNWYIFSYGSGSAPEANTVEDAVALANKVI
jgi:hypothetical protein